jgi:hypothetical protein
MKTQTFTPERLANPVPRAPKRRAPALKKPGDLYPGMTDWGREALKRIHALHKAMDGKPLE